MEHNQDLTAAYVTVKVNGGVNVLRNIFHFNSEAIEDAFRNEFNDMARLTDFVAVSAAQIGASISYAEERAVLTLGLILDIECDEKSLNIIHEHANFALPRTRHGFDCRASDNRVPCERSEPNTFPPNTNPLTLTR